MAEDDDDPSADPEFAVESKEKFYRGTIVALSRGAQRGTIRSANGRQIPFYFAHLTMLGPHRHFQDLCEGLEVGYDVSWTSKGLCVSVIRIPD